MSALSPKEGLQMHDEPAELIALRPRDGCQQRAHKHSHSDEKELVSVLPEPQRFHHSASKLVK